MYNAGLVCVVKVNGKILRENKDEVLLPFDSEYSILIKNLETRKALVKITVDNQDVLDGNSLIISPNSEMELEGFMKGMIARNRFKFIKKTKQISDFRGDKIDDGIIRIEYWFEQQVEEIKKKEIIVEHHHYNCNNNCLSCGLNCCNRKFYWYTGNGTYNIGSAHGTLRSSNNIGVSEQTYKTFTNFGSANNITSQSGETFAYYSGTNSKNESHNITAEMWTDDGITVKGSQVHQQFNYGLIGELEKNSRVIILKLIGLTESGNTITKPITVKSKKTCNICGKKSKSNVKFCSNCGTFLE